MSLTEGDKNTCREIAREIISEVLKEHIQQCPHGRSLLKFIFLSIGIAIGSGITGGGMIVAVIKAMGLI